MTNRDRDSLTLLTYFRPFLLDAIVFPDCLLPYKVKQNMLLGDPYITDSTKEWL